MELINATLTNGPLKSSVVSSLGAEAFDGV